MNKQFNWLKTVIFLLLIVVLAYLIWNSQSLIFYVLIAGVISIIASPLVTLIEKLNYKKIKIPRAFSAFLALTLIWSIVFGIMSIVIPIITSEVNLLSNLDYDLIANKLKEPILSLDNTLRIYGVLGNDEPESLSILKDKIRQMLNMSDIATIFTSILNGLGNLLIAFFSISFVSFFFIKEKGMFRNVMFSLIPDKYNDQFSDIVTKSKKLLTRYFLGVLLQISILFTLLFCSLLFFGVKNAFLIAVFAAIINIIPYIGPFIGVFVGVIIAISTGLDTTSLSDLLPLSGIVVIIFLLVQLLDNLLFQPLIFSNSVHAHPLEIFLVISIAGTLGGVVPMIIAIPFYTVVRIIAKEFLSQFKIVKDLTGKI